MKKILLSVAMFIALSASVSAQSPNEFNYQSVARDASGNVIANQSVGVQISIIATDPTTGTVVYTEEHTVTTNDFGLMNFTIGSGTVTAGDFTTIDWGNDAHFVEISMDLAGGTSYTLMGTQQLVSVPYALHAETASSVANDMVDDADADPLNEIQVLSISNDTLYLSNGGFVDLASYAVDNVDDADADPTNELQDWTTLPGIPADFSDNVDNVDDADNDPFNEIQTIVSADAGNIATAGSDGGAFISSVDDADADPTNELQDWTTLPGIPADFSDNVDNVDDADNDPFNEIQTIVSADAGNIATAGSDGGAYISSVNDADADPTNELQDWTTLPGIPADFSDNVDNVDDADNDPTNELQDWSTLPGIPAGLLDGIDDVDDADNDPTNEIETWSTLGGIPAGFLDGIDNVDDADNDPTNELQDWTTLPGIPAGFSDNVDNVDDADNDPTNEIETWSTLAGIPADFADGVDNVDDADADATNEIQSLSYDNNTGALTLSNGGGTVTIPEKVSFLAANLNVGTMTPGVKVFQVEEFDNGGGYNPANGVYTAPSSGTYMFHFSFMTNAVNVDCMFGIEVNGALRRRRRTNTSNGGPYRTVELDFLVNLNAGDQVVLRHFIGNVQAYSSTNPIVENNQLFYGYKIN